MDYALITGASSGIGLEYARQLARGGYNVIIVSNRDEDNRRVAAEIAAEYSVSALPLYADLSQEGAADRIYEWVTAQGLTVDILINNAGMLLFSTLEHTDPSRIDRIIALHCTNPTHLCRLFGSDMKRRRSGRILIMSSITAWTPYPTMSHYGATKVYLRNFGQSLWYEMRDYGVSVTTVFPSAVDTPLYDLDEKVRKRLLGVGLMMSAGELARRGLNAMFRGRRRCIPGFATKLEYLACSLLPARALLPLLHLPPVKRLLSRL